MTTTPVPAANGSLLSGQPIGRRALLGTAAAIGGAAALGLSVPASAAAGGTTSRRRRRFRNSLSVSPFTEAVLAKTALRSGRQRATTVRGGQELFNRHGATEVYVRVATRRQATDGDAEHGVDRAVERARLAKRLGMPLNPELGLWAVYGDIALQPSPDFSEYPQIELPGPWISLTIDQMCTALGQYGRLVARQILSTGVDVEVWDLGNEVEFGVAGVAIPSFTTSNSHGWTYAPPNAVNPAIGQMSAFALFAMSTQDRNAWLSANLWPYVGKLLAAVAAGIRSVDRHARFSTHTSTIALQLPDLPEAFWKAMQTAGFHADQLGTSYYPTSATAGDQLAALKTTVAALEEQFDRPVFLAETGYPSATMGQPYPWNNPVPGYDLTPDGQYAFFRDVAEWGSQSGLLSGIRLWAPDYCTGGWQPMSCFEAPDSHVASAKPLIAAVAAGIAR